MANCLAPKTSWCLREHRQLLTRIVRKSSCKTVIDAQFINWFLLLYQTWSPHTSYASKVRLLLYKPLLSVLYGINLIYHFTHAHPSQKLYPCSHELYSFTSTVWCFCNARTTSECPFLRAIFSLVSPARFVIVASKSLWLNKAETTFK